MYIYIYIYVIFVNDGWSFMQLAYTGCPITDGQIYLEKLKNCLENVKLLEFSSKVCQFNWNNMYIVDICDL